ncbi:MAG: HEAT repeat domain-containing protein [Methanoregula sp.]
MNNNMNTDHQSEILVDFLILKLKCDKDEIVRSSAAGALGRIKSEKSIDPLIYALKDRHTYVRHVAAWALGEIASTKAIDALNQTVLTDDDELTRGKATEALWKIQRKSEVNFIEFR